MGSRPISLSHLLKTHENGIHRRKKYSKVRESNGEGIIKSWSVNNLIERERLIIIHKWFLFSGFQFEISHLSEIGMLTLSSPISPHNALQNPRPAIRRRLTALNCKGIQLSVPSHCYTAGGDCTSGGVALKSVDVATLGNLCVDLVLNVPELPPASFLDRKAYMERLAASPPDKVSIAQSSMFCVLFIFPFLWNQAQRNEF